MGDEAVKELVGDVGAVAFSLKEATEPLGVLDVFRGVIPTKLVKSGLSGVALRFGVSSPDAPDEMARDRFIQGFSDHFPADSGVVHKVLVGDIDSLLLRVALLVAPPKRLADHVGDKPDNPARRAGEAHIKELVRCVGRVARRRGETPKRL